MAAVTAPVAVAGPVTTEFGHSVPPEGPHTVTFHVPGWDTAIRFRDGDLSIFAKLRSIYPRFTPFGPARQLANALGDKLGAVPGQDGVFMFLHPDTFAAHRAYSTSHYRKEHRLTHADLGFHVVDVRGVRLYCVVYALAKTPGAVGIWQHAGTGVSTRLAEALVPFVETDFALVDWEKKEAEEAAAADGSDLGDVPAPTYLPEGAAHAQLRRRIRDLLHRAPVDPDKVAVQDGDVYLYQTGMAAIYRLMEALARRDPQGTILVLGSLFHNTYHLLEETPAGMKHFAVCDATSGVMDEIEAWLEGHYREGKTVGYAFLEFPSNPLLVSADLKRLRQIADKYAFPIVVDETISSFANIDVLPVADCVVSSLTKSFSGYADVMAGSVVLNPLAPSYAALKPLLASLYHNELFVGDADVLLANSADYLARTAILNRNAAALAALLAEHCSSSSSSSPSPIRAVLYPTTSDTLPNYDAFRRPATADLPATGHGCLLSVDFRSVPTAAAFYDALPFHCGPHLGAHRTLAVPFNALVWGRDPADADYHARYGARQAQIRLSVGLEDEAELLAGVRSALARAVEVYNSGGSERSEGKEKEGVPQKVVKDAGEAVARVEGGAASSEADVKVVAEETSANYDH